MGDQPMDLPGSDFENLNLYFALPLGRAQFSSIPTNQGSKLEENANLGGTEFSFGLSFHF